MNRSRYDLHKSALGAVDTATGIRTPVPVLLELHPAPYGEGDDRAHRPVRPVAGPDREAHVKRDASRSISSLFPLGRDAA